MILVSSNERFAESCDQVSRFDPRGVAAEGGEVIVKDIPAVTVSQKKGAPGLLYDSKTVIRQCACFFVVDVQLHAQTLQE